MNLKPNEKILKGNWVLSGGSVKADSESKRIEWLTVNYLIKVSEDESGWFKLYKDPENNRYWELVYPNSEDHGGGAPHLINISAQEAEKKYLK